MFQQNRLLIVDRKIRIALVGCGRISEKHILAILSESHRVEIAAICDIRSDRLELALKLIDATCAGSCSAVSKPACYFSYEQLLSEVKKGNLSIDLVVLTSPSGLHPGQAISAAQIGLNVCTEKPMATRWSDGLAMVQACDEAGVNLFVVKQNRFNSTLQLLRKQLAAGRFGRLAMVAVNVFWQRPQSYYDHDAWRGTWEFDGGALMNQASHYIDLLDWLIGPVESVSASIATLARTIEVEDTAALQIRWRNGALGTMAVTMLTFPKNLEGSITILGETGTVKIGGPALNQIVCWEFANQHADDELVDKVSYNVASIYGPGHTAYYVNMLDALQGKAEPMCLGRDGLRSLELLICAYRSARDGRTVHLPLEY
jgi:UDP-N-acetyl-2-amino-2-deoxyglucuronate dehydrogenase